MLSTLKKIVGLSPERASGSLLSAANPKVEPGSMLATLAGLNTSSGMEYAKTIAAGLRDCMGRCSIDRQDVSVASILEQIHTLKNAVAPTGSDVLLGACEQLRRDACDLADRGLLQKRYVSIAALAAQLVDAFTATLDRPPLPSSTLPLHDPHVRELGPSSRSR